MTMTDPIADMLTRIRNAYKAGHNRVDVPSSKLKKEVARILLGEKMISNYREIKDDRQNVLRVYLKYGANETPVMLGSRKISKPGLKIYKSAEKIERVRNGLGVGIISTSRGLLTDREARKLHVGGEVIAHLW
jgi:small subunit ribosomal protein S8